MLRSAQHDRSAAMPGCHPERSEGSHHGCFAPLSMTGVLRRCMMPVLTLECPECGHRFQGLVLVGTRPPEEWVCSKCGSRKAEIVPDKEPVPHPWEGVHGVGLCPCCN